MNERARKKARRAELEYVLLGTWDDPINQGISFADWLESMANSNASWWNEEAKELIALYESNPCGCEPTGEREGL